MNFNQLIFIFLSFLCLPFYGQDIESKLAMKKGNNAYLNGDYNQSNELYNQSLKMDTSNAKAAFNNGNSSFMGGDFETSRSNYAQFIDSDNSKEEKSKAYYNIGNSYLTEYAKSMQDNNGQAPNTSLLSNAVENYKNSLRNNPKDEDARYNLSYAVKLLQQNKDQQNKDQQNEDQQNKDQQNKDQQNKDQQNKDQQNKDQQNKDQQNKDQQNKDQQNKDQQNKDQQNKDQQNKEQQKKNQQQEKQAQSKQQALKNLDAINGDEEKILMKVNRNKGDKKKKSKTKDW